ncbi:hypothetical protein BGZ99_008543 [Dissophora globulifera]|uniref:Uncharacterized protein n=1 Tax=Dissophora globulifera TaxID=979702 RepID=A0A9P6RTV5_9FUNG|nr:hypothetical protein BGZ99_008543 [Dissophora globulifera]
MAAEVRLANTPITDLDPTLTKDILYARLADILNKNDIDEIGFLPFLPDEKDTVVSEQQQAGKGTSSTYPFVVQEHGTKLGIPIYCWVPILDAASAVLKDAIFAVKRGNEASQLEDGRWWADPGIVG